MNKEDLKIYLKDNPELIRDILEDMNCHHIKIIHNKKVQSALPDGDNNTSIQIKLNEYLTTKVYTRNDFLAKEEFQDFYSLVNYLKGYKLSQSIKYIGNIVGVKVDFSSKDTVKSNSYEFLKKYSRAKNKEVKNENIEEIILPETFKERFVNASHIIYEDDGVTEDSQAKFGIMYDVCDNRIITPIRNDDGRLVSFKGRTCDKDYIKKGIPKFLSYYPYSAERYLYGYYENYFNILTSDEVYIGEAEKFVLQCDSMGINNAISLSKKVVSPLQLKKILKLGKSVVLTFDKDVTLEEIYIECRKFNRLLDVYYIYDKLDLLKGKESPTDKGLDIFIKLTKECKFKYKGE